MSAQESSRLVRYPLCSGLAPGELAELAGAVAPGATITYTLTETVKGAGHRWLDRVRRILAAAGEIVEVAPA